MPERTLRLLIEQAAQRTGRLDVRGLKNAPIQQTAALVQQLMGQSGVKFQIDPQAFDRFGILFAPTFVMVKAGGKGFRLCGRHLRWPDAFVSIAGDVSIDYALRAMAQRAPRFKSGRRTVSATAGGIAVRRALGITFS